jgi:hypothetical protein
MQFGLLKFGRETHGMCQNRAGGWGKLLEEKFGRNKLKQL